MATDEIIEPVNPASSLVTIHCADWELAPASLLLKTPSGSVRLPPKAVSVLEHLITCAPATLTIQELTDRSWGAGTIIGDNVVHRIIADLRRALGDSAKNPRFIETIPRRGYRFIGEPVTVNNNHPLTVHKSAPGSVNKPLTRLLAVTSMAIFMAMLIWVLLAREPGIQPAAILDENSPLDRPVLLVEMLEDLSDQPQEHMAPVLTEELSLSLSRLRGIDTLSHNTTRYLTDDRNRLEEVIRISGATHRLEGSFRLAQDQIRVVLRLLDAITAREVVTVAVTRDFTDLAELQRVLARELVDTLSPQFAGLTYGEVASYDSSNAQATKSFLQARQLVMQDNTADLLRAIEHLNRAVEQDPKFSRAWQQLALATYQLGIRSGQPRETESQLRALLSRARAVANTPEVNEAVERLIFVQQNRWDKTEPILSRTLAQTPTPRTYNLYGYLLANAGLVELGLEYYRRALELDPFDPNTIDFVGALTLSLGNPEAALPYFDRCLKIAPRHVGCIASKAIAELLSGNTTVLDNWPLDKYPVFGRTLRCLAATSCSAPKQARNPAQQDQTQAAYLFALAGDMDQAFAALDKSKDLPFSSARQIRWQNPAPELTRDPRYVQLLHHLRIDDNWQAELCSRAKRLSPVTGIVAEC